MAQTLETFRSACGAQDLEVVDRLREIIASCEPSLEESIKWNAPSFAIAGHHRITLGLERKGGVRVVLHRGAVAVDNADFRFDDDDGLAKWPARDRGVVVFHDLQSVEARQGAFADLCQRWLAKTRPT